VTSYEPAATPALSVVVPAFQVESHLPDCLDSILREAGSGVEVVVVDDASPDRSGQIAAEYARRDPRVRVVRLAINVGLGPARNAGFEATTGAYVWFVDSDDVLPAGAVPAVLDRLATSRPDVLIVDHAYVFESGAPAHPDRPGAGGPERPLAGLTGPLRVTGCPRLLRLAQSACTKIVRRGFLAEIGLRFFPGWYEDSAFSHPLLLAAGQIDVLDRVCYHYVQRDAGGITRTVSARHFEVFDQYQRLFDIVTATPGYEVFRPELFRLMIDHYLVIAGNRRRMPPDLRRAFFRRMSQDYRSRLPTGGYQLPAGAAGLKHRLVRRDAYLLYALLRRVHRAMAWLFRRGNAPAARRERTPRSAVPVPARVSGPPPGGGRTTGR